MIVPWLFFFYTFPASLLFMYGIGLERLSLNARASSRSCKEFLLLTGQNTLLILACISVLYPITAYILFPLYSEFLVPVCTALVLYGAEYGLELIFRHKYRQTVPERVFHFGTVLFALYNAASYLEVISIILCAAAGMLFWSFMLYGIKLRVDVSTVSKRWKDIPLLLISLGIIGLALYAFGSAWIVHYRF